jgi:hypothetical protein
MAQAASSTGVLGWLMPFPPVQKKIIQWLQDVRVTDIRARLLLAEPFDGLNIKAVGIGKMRNPNFFLNLLV